MVSDELQEQSNSVTDVQEIPSDPKSALKGTSREARALLTQMNGVEAQLSALHSKLPEFAKGANKVAESADPARLRNTIAELRVLQASSLQLGLAIALAR